MSREKYQAELARIMPKAIRRLTEALDSEDEKIAVGAARYIIDQVMGKPTQNITDPGAALMGTGAAMLAQVLQQQLTSRPAPSLNPGYEIIEGAVHIGGEPVPAVNADDFPVEA